MEFRKAVIDGTVYNLLTDEDIEDLKVLNRNEELLKNLRSGEISTGVDANEFLDNLEEKYGL